METWEQSGEVAVVTSTTRMPEFWGSANGLVPSVRVDPEQYRNGSN